MGDLLNAAALLEMGRARDALAETAGVLANTPDDSEALLLAARCHLMLDEPRLAVSASTTALAQAPDDPRAWSLTSLAYTAAKDPDRAAWHAEQAIARWPHLPGGHWAFVSARLNQRQYRGQVRAAAAKVVETLPLDPDAHVLAAQAEMYPHRGRPDLGSRVRAGRHLTRAFELDPIHQKARHEAINLAALGWGLGRGLRGAADALKDAPLEKGPLGSIAFIFRRLIWLVHIVIVLAFFGCLFGYVAKSDLAMRVSAGVASLALVLLMVAIYRQLGPSTMAHLRAFPRRDITGTAWMLCLIATVAFLNVGSWVPDLVAVLFLGKVLIWVGAAFSWVPGRYEL